MTQVLSVSFPPLEVFSIGGFLFTKLRSQWPPLALLTTGLIIITLLTTLSGLWHYQYELAHQSGTHPSKTMHSVGSKRTFYGNAGSEKAVATDKSATSSQSNKAAAAKSTNSLPQSAVRNLNQTASTRSTGPANQPTNSTASTPKAVIDVALNVNGQSKGIIRLAAGSNQCDVLSQALANGQISSLDMRYSSTYKTMAVYVIDGIGDPGSVWWTYKVNGRAPPYGCSYTTAHGGDSVNWQYVKN